MARPLTKDVHDRPAGPAADAGPVVVLIPTYNERENLPLIVSPAACRRAAGGRPGPGRQLPGRHRRRRRSSWRPTTVRSMSCTGRARTGWAPPTWPGSRGRWSEDYDVLVEMDADGSHQPEQLPPLLAALADADVVLGSRWVPGGSVVNWPLHRKVLSRGRQPLRARAPRSADP